MNQKYDWGDVPNWLKKGRERTRHIVRMRDGHRCRECKKVWKEGARRFDVHHLNGLCGKKSRRYDRVSDISGLITLCHKCHLSKHVDKSRFDVWRKGPLKGRTNEILKLRRNGLTYSEIGRKFKVSQAAISKHLIKQGL